MNLLHRSFVTSNNLSSSPTVSIAQFNVLADYLADSFPFTDPKILAWDYRKHLLKQEILQYRSNLVCLEEVDHFDDFFLPELKKEGYQGLFKKKVDPNAKDGCAFFYDSNKFELLNHKFLEFGIGMSQVAIIAKLQFKSKIESDSNQICVSVVHMKAKRGFEDLRLNQGSILLNAICDFFATEHQYSHSYWR